MILATAAPAQNQSAEHDTPSPEEAAVASRLAEIQDAAEALDVEKVFSYVLDNDRGALIQDGKVFLTREAALESTRQGFSGLSDISYTFDQQRITILSPTVALAVGEGVTTATTSDGRVFRNRFAQSVVLLKSDGQWKVTHAHRSFPAAN